MLFYPYKPEIFGDKIVVEKRIDLHNSSKLLLKDARGWRLLASHMQPSLLGACPFLVMQVLPCAVLLRRP